MLALFLMSFTPPHPGRSSGKERRVQLFVDAISKLCDRCHFVYFVSDKTQNGIDQTLRAPNQAHWGVEGDSTCIPIRRRTETFFNHYVEGIFDVGEEKSFFPFTGPAQRAAVQSLLKLDPDVVYVDQIRVMQAVIASGTRARIVFDIDDLTHRVHWRAATTRPFYAGKLAYMLQVPAMLAAERRAVRQADVTAVCSETDRAFVACLGAGARAVTIANALSPPAQIMPVPLAKTLLYLGTYGHEPNIHAAMRLIRDIWPLVRQRHPEARLQIAGAGIAQLLEVAPVAEGVTYLGFVENLDALYAETRVVCCPITVGGGTRVKLIEAAAHGRPMVSTRIGAEGLAFVDGIEILLRDSDGVFANACCDLLEDMDLCRRLGAAAHEKMRALYDAAVVTAQIGAITQALLHGDANKRA